MDELISLSDTVVIGKFDSYNGSWNMARNPDNIMEEDPTLYAEGKLYNFKVKEYLVGDGNKDIVVNLSYSFNGEIIDRYIVPEKDKEMVLFLKYNPTFDHYYKVMEPFRFELKNFKLEVKTNLKEIRDNFKDNYLSLLDLKAKIKRIR